MSNTIITDNGIIRFYDGTIIAIEDQEYSPDGLLNWEKTFNPNDHISTLDGVTPIGGHKYKRVKHSGDTSFQLPYRIVPNTPEFRVLDLKLQTKFEDEVDTEWKDLFDLSLLQGEDGEKGEQGIPGEGLNIDIYGYYQARPDCGTVVSGCTTCNPGTSASSAYTTFLSLGDGTLVLTSALISAGTVVVDTVTYSHFSNDLVTWNAISSGIVDFEARYLATDGTGTVYTDMRTEDYYGTRGNIYICADGNWTLLNNISVPSYMVGERSGSTNIGYVDNFIYDGASNFLSNTIGLTPSGKLEVIEQSIDETAFAQTIVDDGLTIPSPTDKIKVLASDFTGFGLSTYTSNADSELDIQVNVSSLLGDGTRAESAVSVDGETRNLLGVDVNDLVNNDSGITAVQKVDTFYDLEVNLGNGLILDGGTPQGITVDVDDLSLIVDATSLRIKPYATGNDGVALQHLNPDIIWANRGLALDTANGLYARIDNTTIGYDGSGNLEVPLNGLTGDRLNDNVADNLRGIEVLNNALSVKVDGITVDYNGSGELEYIGAAGTMVSSITPQHNGTPADLVRDDVTLNLVDGTGIDITMSSVAATDVITVQADIDTTWFDNRVNSLITSGATVYWGTLAKSNLDATTIEGYITGLNHVALNTWYNDTMISSSNGLVLRASSGENYRVIVDANGQLDTVSV